MLPPVTGAADPPGDLRDGAPHCPRARSAERGANALDRVQLTSSLNEFEEACRYLMVDRMEHHRRTLQRSAAPKQRSNYEPTRQR
jgi:hypothetical protein